MWSKASVRSRMLLSTSMVHFMNHITLYAFPSIVIFIRDDIPLSYSEIGLIAAIPTLLMVTLTPIVGRTRIGLESWVILSGLFVMGASLVLMAMAGNILDLAISSVILGIGGAAYHPPGFSMVSTFFEERKGEALALNQGAGIIATGLAPFLLVGASSLIGWQETLILCGGATISIIPLGAILLVGVGDALRSLNSKYPIPQLDTGNSFPGRSSSILVAVISLPLIIALILSACRSTVFRIVTFFTVTLMNDFYGLSKEESGVISSIILLLGVMSEFLGGRISDRMKEGRGKVLFVSAIGMVILSALLALLGQEVPWLIGITIYLLFICSYFFAASNFIALLAEMVPPHLRTAAFGLNFSIGQLAGALAPIIFGYLLDTYGFVAGMLYLVFVSVSALFVIVILNRMMIKAQNSNAKSLPAT
ncbi:MAG: MFS transporter [Candidatus Hodarchaeota archaeon]